jgi:hypothetical protein
LLGGPAKEFPHSQVDLRRQPFDLLIPSTFSLIPCIKAGVNEKMAKKNSALHPLAHAGWFSS